MECLQVLFILDQIYFKTKPVATNGTIFGLHIMIYYLLTYGVRIHQRMGFAEYGLEMGIADDCLCHIAILLEANKSCTHKKLHQSSISRRYLPKNPPSVADDNSIFESISAGLNSFKIHVGQLFWYQWSRKWSSQFIVYIYKTIKKSAFNPYTIHFQGLSILTHTTLFPHAKVLPPSYKLVKKPSSRYES